MTGFRLKKYFKRKKNVKKDTKVLLLMKLSLIQQRSNTIIFKLPGNWCHSINVWIYIIIPFTY